MTSDPDSSSSSCFSPSSLRGCGCSAGKFEPPLPPIVEELRPGGVDDFTAGFTDVSVVGGCGHLLAPRAGPARGCSLGVAAGSWLPGGRGMDTVGQPPWSEWLGGSPGAPLGGGGTLLGPRHGLHCLAPGLDPATCLFRQGMTPKGIPAACQRCLVPAAAEPQPSMPAPRPACSA